MVSVQANGITIEYEVHGAGDPLLMVMGLGGQLIDWPQGLIDELVAHGFQVIVFDNRDSGLSTASQATPPDKRDLVAAALNRRRAYTDYTLDDMAADAISVLDALSIDRAHVLGMSMGGMIAQLIAINFPDRVLSLTSIMSNTGSRRAGQPRLRLLRDYMRRPVPQRELAIDRGVEMFRAVSGPAFSEPEFRDIAARAIDRSWRPDGTARQTAAILASHDRTESLSKIKVPTLVIHGLLDPLVRVSGGIATAKAIPGSRLVLFNDMGHDLPKARWTEIADEVAAVAAHARRVEPGDRQLTPTH